MHAGLKCRTVRNSTLNVTVMPAPGQDDGWARVGASGKHRAIKQPATGAHAGLKQPAGVGSDAAQPCISPAHVRQSQPTPGLETGSQQVLSGSKTDWETARNGKDHGEQPGRCASSEAADCLFSPRPGRSRRRVAVERTEEQVVEQLYQQVQDCRRQVQGSGFYSRLQSALLQLAPLLPPSPPAAAHQPPSPPPHHSSSSPAQPLACGQPSADQAAARQLGGCEVETFEAATGSGGAVQSSAGQQAELKAAAAAAAGGLPTALPACQGPEARVQQLVVYGLGSPQASLTSRYQLALACLLQDSLLPGLTSPPLAFDPAFSSADQRLLSQRLGWSLLQHNEQCARVAAVPTFFYLPHVEGHLCDNLLRANLVATPPSPLLPLKPAGLGWAPTHIKPLEDFSAAGPEPAGPEPQAEGGAAAAGPQAKAAAAAEVPQAEAVGCTAAVGPQAAAGAAGAAGAGAGPNPANGNLAAPHAPLIGLSCCPSAALTPSRPDLHSAGCLPHCILLANRFSTYRERWAHVQPLPHTTKGSSNSRGGQGCGSRGPGMGLVAGVRVRAVPSTAGEPGQQGLQATAAMATPQADALGGDQGALPGAVPLVAPRQSAQQDNADALPPNTTADIALALARIREVAAATEAEARLPAAEGAAGIPDAGSEDGRARGCARLPGPVRPDTMLALLEVAGAVREVAVPEDRDWPAPSAFNDMALHVFPVAQ